MDKDEQLLRQRKQAKAGDCALVLFASAQVWYLPGNTVLHNLATHCYTATGLFRKGQHPSPRLLSKLCKQAVRYVLQGKMHQLW